MLDDVREAPPVHVPLPTAPPAYRRRLFKSSSNAAAQQHSDERAKRPLELIDSSASSTGSLQTSPPPRTPSAPRAQRSTSHFDDGEGAEASDAFDLFEDLPRAFSPPAPPVLPPPPIASASHQAPLPYAARSVVITPRFTGGSASKRTIGPTDFESRQYHLGAGDRRRQLEALGLHDELH